MNDRTSTSLYGVTMNDSATFSTLYGSTTQNTSADKCSFEDYGVFELQKAYFVIAPLLILVNVLLLVVIVSKWSMLRQNAVYRYLISCVLSGIVSALYTAFEIIYTWAHLDYYLIQGTPLQRYDENNPGHSRAMNAWAYRKSLVVSLFLVMEFNILALIYGVSDNTQFVGRYSENSLQSYPAITENLNKNLARIKCIKGKKAKFAFLCALAWLVPIVLTLPTGFGWSCARFCDCLPAWRGDDVCIDDEEGTSCSRIWLPMAGSYIVTVSVFYIFGVVMIMAMLGRTIFKFYRVSAPRKSKFSATKKKRVGKVNAHGRRDSQGGLRKAVSADRSLDDAVQECNEVGRTESTGANDRSVKSRCYSTLPQIRRRPPLHNNIKLTITMAGLLFLTSIPLICVLVYDVANPERPAIKNSVLTVTGSLIYLYVAALPCILIFHMSVIRNAAAITLLKCPCLTTTVIEKQTATTDESNEAENNQISSGQVMPGVTPVDSEDIEQQS